MKRQTFNAVAVIACTIALTGCASSDAASSTLQAYVGARLIDGTGADPIENSVILVDSGVIVAAGPAASMTIPEGVTTIDLAGRTVIPGIINTHGHAGDVVGLRGGQYSRENVLRQLGLYARYGVTTVVSLGGDGPEGFQIRDEQDAPDLSRSRLFVAGPVLTPTNVVEAAEQVAQAAALKVDWAKIKIDSGLGSMTKMNPETYTAVIEQAHQRGIPVAVHVIEAEDAKGAVAAGVDFVAHSVRDVPIDDQTVSTMVEGNVCYSPTLTRELSTFVYRSRPDFFDDPFFLREVDPAVLATLQEPARQQAMRNNAGGKYWEAQLPVAMQNLKKLSDAGALIGMGTDTGVAARFQGYFEHLEMEMMVQAGMTPMQVLKAATGDAARCVRVDEELGTIAAGKRADFVVLQADPLQDIKNTRTIEAVYINGNRVPGVGD